ncbi:MAG: hypothetical protein P4L50_16745 [Anaerolineaceae bacterium]|nr:hypothetical protein [Anaerolineaceae bacterium]
MRAPLATAVAIAIGLVVLLGYFVPGLAAIRNAVLGVGVILAGVATLVGVLNLIGVHWRKMSSSTNRDLYSPFLILAFLITLVAGFVMGGPSNSGFQNVITAIQVPLETSLMAVLAFSLAYASLRLLQRRKGFMSIIFVVSAVVFLIIGSGFLPDGQNIPFVGGLVSFLNQLPMAGSRGILFGIALGGLTTGLRILIGADRPYSG